MGSAPVSPRPWAATWLRDLRVAAGLTQEQLAERAGLAVRSIRDLERGAVKRPRQDSLQLIATALDLSSEASDQLALAFRSPRETSHRLAATEAAGRAQLPSTPAELPRDIGRFVGRIAEIQSLHELLATRSPRSTPPVVVISGPGGFGKSTLAIHVAHSQANQFPDGQVFISLGGPREDRLTTERAEIEILWALGVADHEMPRSSPARGRLLRTLSSTTAMLFVLDDAVDAAHVAGLIPSGPRNAVVITSRSPLRDLDQTGNVRLGAFPREDSVDLLVGTGTTPSSPAEWARLAELCGDSPLALRISAARLSARADWNAADLVSRLEEEQTRLSLLDYGVLGIRACLNVSYQALSHSDSPADRLACSLFARLARLPARDFAVETIAAVVDRPLVTVEAAVERLVDVQLLQSRARDRVNYHDLTLLFARELPADDRTEHDLARLGAALAANVWDVAEIFGREPGELARVAWLESWQRSAREPFGWFRDEVVNVTDYVVQRAAATPEEYDLCRFIVQNTWVLMEHGRLSDTRDSAVAALCAAAEQYDDPLTCIWCERQLSFVHGNNGDLDTAREHLATCETYLSQLPADEFVQAKGQAWVLSLRGILAGMSGELDQAIVDLRAALRTISKFDLPHRRQCLQNLAFALMEAGRPLEALTYNLRLLSTGDHVVDSNSDMVATIGVAETLSAMGRPHDAIRYAESSLKLAEEAQVPRRIYEALAIIAVESYRAGLPDRGELAAERAAGVVLAQNPAAQWSTKGQEQRVEDARAAYEERVSGPRARGVPRQRVHKPRPKH